MNEKVQSSTTRAILSQSEACALSRLLDKLLSRAGDEETDLIDFYDRLSDSLWLARWLRENVSVEVTAAEILDLLEALTVTLEEGHWIEEDCQALQAVVGRLTWKTHTPSMAIVPLAMPSAATSAVKCDY